MGHHPSHEGVVLKLCHAKGDLASEDRAHFAAKLLDSPKFRQRWRHKVTTIVQPGQGISFSLKKLEAENDIKAIQSRKMRGPIQCGASPPVLVFSMVHA